MLCQIIDWYSYDDVNDNEKYKVMIICKNSNNETCVLHIDNFTPYYFLEVFNNWSNYEKETMVRWVENKMIRFKKKVDENGNSKYVKQTPDESPASYSLIKEKCILTNKKKFYGFNNYKQSKFIRLVFNSLKGLKSSTYLFQNRIETDDDYIIEPKKISISGILSEKKINLYESNINPILRLIHLADIKACGWINIDDKDMSSNKKYDKLTHCEHEYNVKWGKLNSVENTHSSKIKLMFFDIECGSSHGDFPLAKKGYTKLIRELVDNLKNIKKQQLITSLDKVINQNTDCAILKLSKIFVKDKGVIKKKMLKLLTDDIVSRISLKLITTSGNSTIGNTYTGFIVERNETETQLITLAKQFICIKNNIIIDEKNISNKYTIVDIVKDTKYMKVLRKNLLADYEDIFSDKYKEYLPGVEGDEVIQIVTSYVYYGDDKPYLNHVLTLKNCLPLEGCELHCFDKEADLLMAWRDKIVEEDPDVYSGYNIYNFDLPFLYERAEELAIIAKFNLLGRIYDVPSKYTVKAGKINSKFVDMPGRVPLDLYTIVMRSYSLTSYNLDFVASHFIRGVVQAIDKDIIKTDSVNAIEVGNYIKLIINNGYDEDFHEGGKKYQILEITQSYIKIDQDIELPLEKEKKYYWCLGKDDIAPKDIFRLQNESDEGRFLIAKYCYMDVLLCFKLLKLLQIISKSVAMANVCSTPLSWIFTRGEGIKAQSLVSKKCKEMKYLIPTKYYTTDDTGYEGAIVLTPYPNIYLKRPVAVLDYGSLYPSSIISKNISHETYCTAKKWLGDEGKFNICSQTDQLRFSDIQYDEKKGTTKTDKNVRFIQYDKTKPHTKGVIPQILEELLGARKRTRLKIKYKTVTLKDGSEYTGLIKDIDDNKIEIKSGTDINTIDKGDIVDKKDTYSPFEKDVLDGEQLAYKLSANSIYGQMGARTSAIYNKDLAAATTATGREQLIIAEKHVENPKNYKKVLKDGSVIYLKNKVVYGDTDSVFVMYDCRDDEGNPLYNRDALKETFKLAVQSEKDIQKHLLYPQVLEYEKIFWPFILIAKKKYVGDKYEFDMNKCKRSAMGIVLKRRDNAPILKIMYSGVIEIIMKDHNISKAIDYIRKNFLDFINGKYPIEKLIITKKLNSFYKNPDTIAHKVLADRITARDPGNAPQNGDRIPFIHIKNDKAVLQGDKIETPTFIKDNNLKPNYDHYITNQLQKPIAQIFALIIETLPEFPYSPTYFEDMEQKLKKTAIDEDTIRKKIKNEREKITLQTLFNDINIELTNRRNNTRAITYWFK